MKIRHTLCWVMSHVCRKHTFASPYMSILPFYNNIYNNSLYWAIPYLFFVFKLIIPTAYKMVIININYIKKNNNLILQTQTQGFALACIVIPDPLELSLLYFTGFYPIPGYTSIQYSAHFGILLKIIWILIKDLVFWTAVPNPDPRCRHFSINWTSRSNCGILLCPLMHG